MVTVFNIPVETISEANAKGRQKHWAVKNRRVKGQRGMAYATCLKYLGCKPKDAPLPGDFAITLTRIMVGRQRPYDGDNLQNALKAVRDGIAEYLGIDDGSDRLAWRYGQEKGDGVRGWVRVEVGRTE